MSVAGPDDTPRDDVAHPIFSREVWITEKRSMSLARDRETGRLLSIEERIQNEKDRNDGSPLGSRLRRVLRPGRKRPRSAR